MYLVSDMIHYLHNYVFCCLSDASCVFLFIQLFDPQTFLPHSQLHFDSAVATLDPGVSLQHFFHLNCTGCPCFQLCACL